MKGRDRRTVENNVKEFMKSGKKNTFEPIGGCPASASNYIKYSVYSLMRKHCQLSLHLETVPMHELDIVLYIYLQVLKRLQILCLHANKNHTIQKQLRK